MEKQFQQSSFEYWGGIECTLNRVQDEYLDQLNFAGHYSRPGDIELIASLGIKKLRYPVLWEMHQQERDSVIDWKWAERQLSLISLFEMQPIVGLVHHGSGPYFTDLLDPSFATGLARYANAFAKKFPWVEYYIPVNEPLTTARFSGLYGFWYPHKRDSLSCMRMLINQLKGVTFAMREIKRINPFAKLIQTEDLAKTHSPEVLRYQADFENHRRWLTFDFLCGKVNKFHPLWNYFIWLGLSEKELLFFQDNPCPPDICGFNYYLTSERYLDDELEFYPEHLHGGNGTHKYVDTEAVRIDSSTRAGLGVLLKEAWERFKLPIAITEVFLSCSQDEQVRWLHDIRQQCIALKGELPEVDFRAITFWALLGEFGWNRVVTSPDGEYECGAFDIQNEFPEETLSTDYIRHLTQGRSFNKKWLAEKGWWERADRFHIKNPCTA